MSTSRNKISKELYQNWVDAVQAKLEEDVPKQNTVKRIVNAFFDHKLQGATRYVRSLEDSLTAISLTDEIFFSDKDVANAVRLTLREDISFKEHAPTLARISQAMLDTYNEGAIKGALIQTPQVRSAPCPR